MPPRPIIIHERLGHWARQLRPRLHAWPVEWAETRSAAELASAARRADRPILVVDLDRRPARGLEDLDAAVRAAPSALSLVLDPAGHPEVPLLARELGATLVLSGVVVPPRVESLLVRWIALTARQAELEGRTTPSPSRPAPEPWDPPGES